MSDRLLRAKAATGRPSLHQRRRARQREARRRGFGWSLIRIGGSIPKSSMKTFIGPPAPTLDSSSLRFLLNSYVTSDRLFGVTKNLQCRTKGYRGPAGTVVRRPMDIVITSALVILIVGCVLGYSFRAEIARDRPAEPRRRRPF